MKINSFSDVNKYICFSFLLTKPIKMKIIKLKTVINCKPDCLLLRK